MKIITRLAAMALLLALTAGCAAPVPTESPADSQSPTQQIPEGTVDVALSDSGITVDGQAISEDEAAPVYLAHDIVYYEDRDTYDSGNPYGEGTAEDRHTAEEAQAHQVIHITQPGIYRLSGTLSLGQVAVDLGEEAKTDPAAVVTLLLDGVDLTCTVAPAVIFYRVYECDAAWVAYDEGETDEYAASALQDTSAAGANVILADGSVNNISGSYVARIYKDNDQQKKLHKYDGAFYSKMSMNVNGGAEGTGVLNITATNEGLDSELHLTINGGRINIQSDNDGINTNEDGVSVTTVNGGVLHIAAGLGAEGDGVDSNGYLVINGGVVIALANPAADSGLDSDLGSYINGGWVLATGSTMDWAESDSEQVTMNLQFAAVQEADEAIVVTDLDGNVLFAYDPDKDEATGTHNRSYQGAILSCPRFHVGETYYVYVGGDVSGTADSGLYDPDTVTGFTGAVRQQYTGSDVGFGRPGGFGGHGGDRLEPPEGTPTEGMGPAGDMERPEGMDPPQDGETPEEAGGMGRPDRGERPEGELPQGEQPPEGMGGGPGGMGQPSSEGQEGSVEFLMTDQVNSFSGVQDESQD